MTGKLRRLANTGITTSDRREYRTTLCRDDAGKFFARREVFARLHPAAKVGEKVVRMNPRLAKQTLEAIASFIAQDRKGGC